MPRLDPKALPEGPFALVVVDGGDDRRLCETLAPALWTTYKLDGSLRALSVGTGFERVTAVAVVTDAEADPLASFETARSALVELEPTLADMVPGEVRQVGPRRYGVFVVPDAVTPGGLETLLRRAWTPTSADPCVDALFACVGPSATTAANRDKAWLKAWTATRRDPDGFPAQLIGKGIDPAHPAFSDLRDFLRAL